MTAVLQRSATATTVRPMTAVAHRSTSGGRILIVGTTNVARSVFAERVLSEGLDGTGIEVTSCGTEAVDGTAMDAQMARQLSGSGNDRGFTAQVLTPALIRDADLVLCMTRAERREVVRAAPRGLRYTYALADFSDVATKMLNAEPDPAVGAGVEESAVSDVARVAVLHRDEVHARLGDEVDVADVADGSGSAHAHVAQQLRELLAPVVAVLRGGTGSDS